MKNPTRDKDEQQFQPKTELARKLWEIRQRAIRDGMRLLDADEIERLVEESRGRNSNPTER